MPEMIKKIIIGSDEREIAAKYDFDGKTISTWYQPKELTTKIEENDIQGVPAASNVEDAIQRLKQGINDTRATMNSNFVNNDGLAKAVGDAIDALVKAGSLEVKAAQTKKITFIEKDSDDNPLKSFSLTPTTGYKTYVKIKIFNSSVSDANTVVKAVLDAKNISDDLHSHGLGNGATYEIYKNMLFITNSLGNTYVVKSHQPEWTSFEIKTETMGDSSFSVMVYEEGWEENTEGGEE